MWAFLVGWLLVVAGGQVVSESAPDAARIRQAIEELGAERFEMRQAATDFLWRAGAAAEEGLREALKSNDPEVRARATALLTRLRLGIRPETSPEVAALIDQFRYAESTALRRQALSELQAKGQLQAILTLLRSEQNAEERKGLATVVAGEAGKLVRPLVERDALDQAEEVLELVAASEPGMAQLTAFLAVTGRLDKQIESTRSKAGEQPSEERFTRLAYLLRAKGELSGAIEAAAKSNDLFLQANLLAENRQWNEAGAIASELARRHPTRLETVAFAATFYRLAGNTAEHQKSIEALLKAANVERLLASGEANKPQDPFGAPASNVGLNYAWTAAETLLVNERLDDALPILKKINPRFAHTILVRQQRHGEALEFVNVTDGAPLDRAWFDKLSAPPGDAGQQQEQRFILAGQVARELRELGKREQLNELLATLRGLAAPAGDRGRRLAAHAATEFQLSRYDDAIGDAAEAIAAGWPAASVFAGILKQQGALATAWHALRLADDPLTDRTKAVEQAVWLVAAQPPRGRLPQDWRQVVTAARASAEKLAAPQKALRLVVLGQTCQIRGDDELARMYFEEAAAIDPAAAIKAADAALAAKNWAHAADLYAKSGARDHAVAYLHGYCLVQAGQAEAGRKQLRLASLAVIAPEARVTMAVGLSERGLRSEAVEQLELVRRTALPDSPQASTAAQFIGNLQSRHEPVKAAEGWEQLLLHVLNATSNFTEAEAYLSLSHLIHKARLKAATSARNVGQSEAELAACDRLLPGDVTLLVEATAAFSAAGLAELADAACERGLAVHQRVIQRFPTSAALMNNGAWLCARSQRKLDQALTLAEKAVELAPEEASYQDTLAEVRFQRGEREAAVAAAKRAVELSPESKLFAGRLKHFQEDEVKTLDRATED